MRKNWGMLVVSLFVLIIPLVLNLFGLETEAETTGTIYYVDALEGKDTNDGQSPNHAWKTLDKVEKTKFEPGDIIRLHEDSVFDDTLFLEGEKNGEGTEGTPIIMESYGDSEGKATINGNGDGLVTQMNKEIYSAFTLYNASHWTIRDLAITNIGKGEDPNIQSNKSRVGFYVLAKNNGLTEDIHVDNLAVSDVNGSWKEKDIGNGGIYFTVSGEPTGEVTRFHNISVKNCQVENVTRTGISVGATVYGDLITPETEATTIKAEPIQQYGHTDVLIENNYVKQSGGDAIVPQFCYKPLIQYNVSDTASFSHSKWKLDSKADGTWQVNAGIWPWLCYFPTFQFNEAFNTVDNYDGEAYDCDSGTGTIYQYNYSHDNEGGFMLICSAKNFDTLIRYNISQNDRKHLFLVSNSLDPNYNDPRYPGISEEETAYVYNNTFYTGEGLDTNVFSQEEPGYVRMKNNIFYNEGTKVTPNWQPAHYGEEHPATINYNRNLYYGYTNVPDSEYPNPTSKNEGDRNKKGPIIVKNPKVELTGKYNVISLPGQPQHERGVTEADVIEGEIFVAPGTGGKGINSVKGYQLVSTSPAINAGVTIEENGGRDYFGTQLSDGKTDIGALEYVGEVSPTPTPSSSTAFILKITDEETGDGLKGAEYKLYKDDTYIKTYTTDEQGKLQTDGLTAGLYKLIETKAPTGYVLDSTPLPMTVIAVSKPTYIDVSRTNKKKYKFSASQIVEGTGDINGTKAFEFEVQDGKGNAVAYGKTTVTSKNTDYSIEFYEDAAYTNKISNAQWGTILENGKYYKLIETKTNDYTVSYSGGNVHENEFLVTHTASPTDKVRSTEIKVNNRDATVGKDTYHVEAYKEVVGTGAFTTKTFEFEIREATSTKKVKAYGRAKVDARGQRTPIEFFTQANYATTSLITDWTTVLAEKEKYELVETVNHHYKTVYSGGTGTNKNVFEVVYNDESKQPVIDVKNADSFQFEATKKVTGTGQFTNETFHFELVDDKNSIVAYGKSMVTEKDTIVPIIFYKKANEESSKISDWSVVLTEGKTYKLREKDHSGYEVSYTNQDNAKTDSFTVNFNTGQEQFLHVENKRTEISLPKTGGQGIRNQLLLSGMILSIVLVGTVVSEFYRRKVDD